MRGDDYSPITRVIYAFILLLMFLIVAGYMMSCNTVRYVPLEKVKTEYKTVRDTVYASRHSSDSLMSMVREKDSVIVSYFEKVRLNAKGDTVGIDSRMVEKHFNSLNSVVRNLRAEIDSLRLSRSDTVIRTDSIPYAVKVKETKTVRKMYGFQKLFMWIGIASALVLGCGLVLRVRKKIV